MSSNMQDIRAWVVNNKLKAVFSIWASTVAGSLAYQWARPIPTSLKLIHARVYAQALTLAAMAAAGTVHWVEGSEREHEPGPPVKAPARHS